jgi:hypothetical protein
MDVLARNYGFENVAEKIEEIKAEHQLHLQQFNEQIEQANRRFRKMT